MNCFLKHATYLAMAISIALPTHFVFAAELTLVEQDKLALVIAHQEQLLDGIIGVALHDTATGKTWSYNGNSLFPIVSTFKTLACAKLLNDVEQKKLALTDSITITPSQLVTYSPVTEQHINRVFSFQQACDATMATSDNTAANIVLSAIGGPKSLTQFIAQLGDDTTRLDRIEPGLNEAKDGDLRDTTTPLAINATLDTLLLGSRLTEPSKQQLITWMKSNSVSGSLLRSVLPEQWQIADRSGAGGFGARAITAVVWPKQHQPLVMSIYIKQTAASFELRNQAIARIGEQIFSTFTARHAIAKPLENA